MPFGNLILIIPKMCIVRYISDSMIVPDNQEEESFDGEENVRRYYEGNCSMPSGPHFISISNISLI